MELLTGRVTALEHTKAISTPEGNSDRNFYIALAALLGSWVGIPIMLLAWIQPHLENDLKSDVKIEVAEQLKDPLKQVGEIAGDVREIKGSC